MPDDETQTETTETTVTETPEPQWFQKIYDPAKPGYYKKNWQEDLPPEFEPYKSLASQYNNPLDMLKAHKEAVTMARNRAGVRPLTPESTPEEVAAYRQAMGIPEVPYEFKKPEKLPDGIAWQDERVKAFGQWAHERNLTPQQAQDALDLHLKFLAEDHGAITKAQQEEMERGIAEEKETLRTKWGGKLSSVVTDASRAAVHFSIPPDFVNPDSPQFKGVIFLDVMSQFARAVGESKLPSAASVVNDSPMRRYQAIVSDKTHPKHALWAKGDKTVLAEMDALLRQAKQAGEI